VHVQRADEEDLTALAQAVRRLIGYVPQPLSADGALTGYENLLIFAKLYDILHAERERGERDAHTFMGLADAAHGAGAGQSLAGRRPCALASHRHLHARLAAGRTSVLCHGSARMKAMMSATPRSES
jgi:ABC-type Na+ transport system ATPase subunit NatA